MKKIVVILVLSFVAIIIIAQTPQSIKYQAVVRDNSGTILSNQSVSFRISIRNGSAVGTVVYQETHSTTTNQFGLANLDIGEGTPITGTFSSIDWGTGLKYLETELDPAGGNSYMSLGTSQMLSVPYALYSENTANIEDADADPGNELQSLSIAGNDLSISNGNTVILPAELPIGTSGQTLRHNGTSWEADNNLINTGISIGIGSAPDASAMLDINSTTRGILIPRLTTLQRTGISSPANGLMVFDTGTKSFWFYEGTFPGWVELVASNNNSSLADEDGDTQIQAEKTPDEDIIRFDMAGTEFFVMDSGRLEVMNTGRSVFIGIHAGANDDLTENHNNFVGYYAGEANTTGFENTANGYYSLRSNNSGNYNTAMGAHSLYNNQSGEYNTALGYVSLFSNITGHHNTAIGHSSLFLNNTGHHNTAIGNASLYSHRNGAYNTAIGESALYQSKTGWYNTAIGWKALKAGGSGHYNTAVGSGALAADTTGSGNTAVGISALGSNTTGSENSALGNMALFYNKTGYSNVAIGVSSLQNNTESSNLVAIGDSALYNNGIGATSMYEGVWNTAVGSKALLNNNTGSYNTSVGFETLYDNTSGYWNTANGFVALRHNTTGHDNTATGAYALADNTEGIRNTANGFHALSSNTIGNMNTATGALALNDNTSGSYNTAIGNGALLLNKNGSSNTAIGSNALSSDTSGHANVAVGASALYYSSNGSNLVAIGDSALYNNGWGDFYSEAIRNTAVGSKSLYSNSTGGSNTALGYKSLYNEDYGSGNTAVGSSAGRENNQGDNNTFIGASAGLNNVTGSGNVFIGYEAGMNETGSNKLVIANNSGSKLIYGDFTTGNVGFGVTPPTEKLQVAGIVHSTLNGFKFPDGSIQSSAATTFALPYDGTASGNPAFSITNTAQSIAIRGLATDNSAGTNYGGYFEAYRTQGRGVAGAANGIEGWGVFGLALGSNGTAVRGEASGTNGTGIYGEGNAWAGYFMGNLYASGNVGFGTTIPVEEVEIHKDQNDWTILQLTNINTGSNAGSALYFYETIANQAYIAYTNSGNMISSYGPNSLAIQNYGPVFLTADNSSLILQSSNGRVAIGNENPIGKFDVYSNLRYSGRFTSDSSSDLTHVIHAEYTGGINDAKGVYGKSVPSDYYGYGGYFEGGYIGVRGEVFPSGSYVYFGLQGEVFGGSGTNYAVSGYAAGSGTNYAGYFDGNVTVTGTFVNPSDEKLKKNIQPFANALSKVDQLTVHTFEFRTSGDAEKINLPVGNQIGFTAQEMENVLPHLVSEQVHTYDRNQGIKDAEKDIEQFTYKGVNYIGMIPVLTQAIKEQQEIIEDQQSQIDELRKMVLKIETIESY